MQSGGQLGGSYNRGDGVTVAKLGTGQYRVTFEGIPASGANAQVVAYGSGSSRCKLFTTALPASGGSSRWHVTCHDASGSLADSAFTIVTTRSPPGPGGDEGYLTSSTGGSVSHSWNSTGATNSVSYNSSTKRYTVSFPGMTTANAAVHATAMGVDDAHCKVRSWGTGSVNVECYDSSGTAVASAFSVSFKGINLFQSNGGHAWVSNGSISPSYSDADPPSGCPTTPSYTATPNGLDLTLTLPNVDVAPSSWTEIVPMVTAYGSTSNHCKIVSWGASGGTATYGVRCFDDSGTQINAATTAFSTSVASNRRQEGC